jgi:S1-C subfamily serine protease
MTTLAFSQEVDEVRRFEKELKATVGKVRPAFCFVASGSGVLISKDGWILTNHHVAGPTGKRHRVYLTGGKSYNAKVIGHDPLGDISLLKIDKKVDNLPYLELGDSDDLRVGQSVIAMGNPFLTGSGSGAQAVPGYQIGGGNWEPTITLGIVSALHRYQDWYMDAIQTDAQINPGNSGGPLITLDGKIVGINGRIAMRYFNRVNTGVGYAIPSTQIRRYMEAFKKGGRVYHGMIDGATVVECGVDDYVNSGEYGDGVLIVGVSEPSPAHKAGFREGDIITRIDKYTIFNLNRYHGVVGTFPAGEMVVATVKRGGTTEKLTVVLGDAKLIKKESPEY